MKFRPKYSILLLLFILSPTHLLVLTTLWDKIKPEFYIPQVITLIILQIIALLTYFGFRYELTRDELIIKGLFYHKVIPLESIFKAELVNDFSISPASSPKKIKLSYNKTFSIEIAPKFRTIFITELTNRNPHIIVRLNTKQKVKKKMVGKSLSALVGINSSK